MNKNQVKGTVKEVAGKVQEGAGKLVGSKEHQAKGLGKQVAGKAEKAYGNAPLILFVRTQMAAECGHFYFQSNACRGIYASDI